MSHRHEQVWRGQYIFVWLDYFGKFSEITNLLCAVGCFAELEEMVCSSRVPSEVRAEGWLEALCRPKELRKPLWLGVTLNPYLRSTFVSIGRYFPSGRVVWFDFAALIFRFALWAVHIQNRLRLNRSQLKMSHQPTQKCMYAHCQAPI